MTRDWEQLKEIVASALERSPAERAGFVDRECGNDATLRAEVESLLSHYDECDNFLDRPPVDSLLSAASDPMIGVRLGPYRITRECGHGGMAVVYQAERVDEEFRKTVAIKMVRYAGDGDHVLRRFRNERQTLAALDHPNIVKLLDGGSTGDGRPYLVMEFVDGLPIDRHCDAQRLTIPERLRLFQSVCHAVQYAHARGVVHRDLKPSNILVTADGVVRLLDFGIAKLLNAELSQATLVTQGDWRPLTPEYASPEQLRGDAITPATDIYSLGVLLYQLLCGDTPYRTGNSSLADFERLVCQTELPKPSTRITTQHDAGRESADAPALAAKQICEARRSQPAELRRRLHGDLDTIVVKALRKEPDARYASPQEFADDVERHLAGQPILARRPSLPYYAVKFVRRHGEALATIAIVALLALAITAAWQLRTTRRPAPGPASAVKLRRSVAVLGFQNLSRNPHAGWMATALSEMLTGELSAGEKLRAVSPESVARAKAEWNLSETAALSPEAIGNLARAAGSDFVVTGSYLAEGDRLDDPVRLDLRLEDASKGEVVAAVSESGSGYQLLRMVADAGAKLRNRLGVPATSEPEAVSVAAAASSNPDAMRLYFEGLEKLRSFDPLSARDLLARAVAADPAYPMAHAALAQALQTLGYDGRAMDEAKKALDLAGSLSREQHLLISARYFEMSRNWPKAIESYRALYSYFPDNLEYGLALANAETLAGKGKDSLATLASLTAALSPAKDDARVDLAASSAAAQLGDNHRRLDAATAAASKAQRQGLRLLLGHARMQECRALANLGDVARSNAACSDAVQILSRTGDRGGLAQALHTSAEVPLNQGDLATAEKLYSQALDLTRAIGDQKGTARELMNLGVVAKSRGDFSAATRLYAEALRYYRTAGDKQGVAFATGNTGNLLQQQGRLGEAMSFYQQTLALSQQLSNRSSVALSLAAMGDVAFKQGDLDRATQLYRRALAVQQAIGDKAYQAATLVAMGRVARYRGDQQQARELLQQALDIDNRLGDAGDAADARVALAEVATDAAKTGDAVVLLRSALQQYDSHHVVNAQIAAETELARAALVARDTATADESIRQARKLLPGCHDVVVQMSFAIQSAAAEASRDRVAAIHELQAILTKADGLGLVPVRMQAALTLGRIEVLGSTASEGRARLRQLARDARRRGFGVIAQQALASE